MDEQKQAEDKSKVEALKARIVELEKLPQDQQRDTAIERRKKALADLEKEIQGQGKQE